MRVSLSRFRFLMTAPLISHAFFVQLVYVSMILHNLATIRKDDAFEFDNGLEHEWESFYEHYGKEICPTCAAKRTLHCPHILRNKTAPPLQRASTSKEFRTKIMMELWDRQDEETQAILASDLLERADGRR